MCAIKGYQCTCQYDKIIGHYLKSTIRNATSDTISLKYGLNPHQTPAKLEFSPTGNTNSTNISNYTDNIANAFSVLNGNLGYINVLDIIQVVNIILNS